MPIQTRSSASEPKPRPEGEFGAAQASTSNNGWLWVTIVISAICAAALVLTPQADSKFFNSQPAWQLTTQFVFVGLLGAAVAVVYRQWETKRANEREDLEKERERQRQDLEKERERQRQDLEKERERQSVHRASLTEFYRSTVDLYHECKRIRRMLRAASIRTGERWEIERERYEQLMDQLDDAQLRVEGMVRQVAAQSDLFGDAKKDLPSNLEKIEKYLRKPLDNYEDSYAERRVKDKNALIGLDEDLTEFVKSRGRRRDTLSTTEFFDPADNVRKLILDLIEKTTSRGTLV
jgi:hypothetical protein